MMFTGMGQTFFYYDIDAYIVQIPELEAEPEVQPAVDTEDIHEESAEEKTEEEPDLTSTEIITEEEYELIETGYVVELLNEDEEEEGYLEEKIDTQ